MNRGKPLPVVAKASKFVGGLRQLVRRLEGGDQKAQPQQQQKTSLPFLNLLKKKK